MAKEWHRGQRDEAGKSAGIITVLEGGRPGQAGECAQGEPPDTVRPQR